MALISRLEARNPGAVGTFVADLSIATIAPGATVLLADQADATSPATLIECQQNRELYDAITAGTLVLIGDGSDLTIAEAQAVLRPYMDTDPVG